MLHAHSIRWCIENGFEDYHFLRGNEAYKYAFAVAERRLRRVAVTGAASGGDAGRLDHRSLPAVLALSRDLQKAAKATRPAPRSESA